MTRNNHAAATSTDARSLDRIDKLILKRLQTDGRKSVSVLAREVHLTPSPCLERIRYTKLKCDIAGYVLSGSLVLDLKGEKKRTLRSGHAFYVTKGTTHRGYALGSQEARLITVSYPASY